MTVVSEKVEIVANKHLVKAVKNAIAVMPRKGSLPVFTGALVDIYQGSLMIKATDADIWYEERLRFDSLDAEEDTGLVVSRDALKTIKVGSHIKMDSQYIEIDGISFVGISAEEWPSAPMFRTEKTVGLPPSYFTDLKDCAMSVATHDARPALHGVYHEKDAIVAIDGYRLARMQVYTSGDMDAFVLPASAAGVLSKAMGGYDARLGVSEHGEWVEYNVQGEFRQVDIMIRTLGGKYPGVSRVIPNSQDVTGFVLNLSAWNKHLDAVLKVHASDGKRSQAGSLVTRFDIENQLVTFGAQAHSGAKYTGYETVNGTGEVKTRFNAKYLKTAINQVGENAKFNMGLSDGQPILFTSEDGRRQALVSPVAKG